MVSRRTILANAMRVPIVGLLLPRLGIAQSIPPTFDYYIGPSGSDSNAGTLASPWAITSLQQGNANNAKMASKKIGLLPGTYSVYALNQTAAGTILTIPAGTSGAPTVVSGIYALGQGNDSIITGASGSSLNGNGNILGSGENGTGTPIVVQYITIQNLEINGSSDGLISFAGSNAAGQGIIIQGCRLHNVVNPSGASNSGGISLGSSCLGALVSNCHIYDCYEAGVARNTHGNSAAIYDWAVNTTVQFCTIHDCNSHIYQKNQNANPPPSGGTYQNNYMWYGNSGSNLAFDGFNNAYGTNPPYAATTIRNNVVELTSNSYFMNMSNAGANFQQAPTFIYNNTVYSSGTGGLGGWVGPTAGAPWKFLSVYNNIFQRLGAADDERGDLSLGPTYGDWRAVDYNCWAGANPQFGVSSGCTAIPSSLLSLASWRAQSGTPDIHSITSNPGFASSITAGAGPAQYKLGTGSPCIGGGRVGGVSSGSSVDMGAWGGATLIGQIGINFGVVVAIPNPPSNVTVTVT